MPNLVLVTHYYPNHLGGIEIVAREVAVRLARRGFRIVWIASGPAPEEPLPGVTFLPSASCNVTERLLGFPYPLWGPPGLLRLRRVIRDCDLVHLHDSLYLGNATAAAWCHRLGKPYVVTQHIGAIPYSNPVLRGLMGAANHIVARRVLAGATRVAFISRTVQGYFSRFVRFQAPPRLIPNGVFTGQFRPASPGTRAALRRRFGWPDGRLVMLFVGRYIERKGLRWLRLLAERFPECEWRFIGSGPEDPARWKLPNAISLGRLTQSRIREFYQAADLLVLPSVGEGFPLVVQEAMACGTPALVAEETASAVPGVEDVCFSCPLSEESLVATVRELVGDPDRLASLRAEVAERARRNWDWERCADEMAALLDAAIARGEVPVEAPSKAGDEVLS